MYGLIVKLTVIPGRREDMIALLRESAARMPGCLRYVVAKDSGDDNALWVTEVWESSAHHDASLSLPSVQQAVPKGRQLVTKFEKLAVTAPVWGVGIPARPP